MVLHRPLRIKPGGRMESSSSRLKKMYAEERLKAEIIQEAMAKKW